MTSNQKNWTTVAVTAIGSVALAGAYLQYAGLSDESVRLLLRLTARLAFFVFVLVFIARPLRDIVKTQLTRTLLANRRQLGLVVATLMYVHLGLIGYRFGTSSAINLDASAIFGGVAYAMLGLMFVTSFDAVVRAMGPRRWRLLHKTGIYVVAIPFVATLLPETRDQLFAPDYVGFTVLIAFAAFIRLMAYFTNRKRSLA